MKVLGNMSRSEKNRNQQLRELNDSILNHLFLPIDLPFSSEKDYCLRSNHRNEYLILEYLKEFFQSYQLTNPMIECLINCTERWSIIQNNSHLSISNIKSLIEQLPSASFLPIYMHNQNSSILIEIDQNNANEALICSWQVLLPIETRTSSIEPTLSTFPVNVYRLSDRSQLISTVHCELLLDLIKNQIEYPTIRKGSREIIDKKDVSLSDYVCQWWIQHFSNITMETNSTPINSFRKKYRDQIRCNSNGLPFRRSGLWMSIKVVFQTILTKHFGILATIVYKLLITHFLTYAIYTRQTSMNSPISIELLIHCLRKILRRLNKIENLLSKIDTNVLKDWIQLSKDDIHHKIDQIFPKIN